MLRSEPRLLRPVYRNFVLAMITMGFTLNFLDRQILTILMQPIKAELHVSDTALGFLSGLAFALFYAMLGIPVSRWADRGSRQLIMSISMALWSAATALCGVAQSFTQLFIARIGVGVGEAGFTPSGLGMIADYFPRSRRGIATGIVNTGPMFGMMLGLLIGGWAASAYGWRSAFLISGIPGILFALLFWLTVREPWRGMADGEAPTVIEQPNFGASIAGLWKNKAYRFLVLGGALSAFALYGESTWMPSFLARSHGLQPKEVGALLGPLTGVVGGIGMVVGGHLTDRLSRRDPRWSLWMPAVASVVAIPPLVLALTAPDKATVIVSYAVAYFLNVLWVAPTFVAIQSLVASGVRISALAWKLFFTNLIGLGLGPQLIGIASDLLAPARGIESLRTAMLCAAVLLIAPTMLYLAAARSMKDSGTGATAPVSA